MRPSVTRGRDVKQHSRHCALTRGAVSGVSAYTIVAVAPTCDLTVTRHHGRDVGMHHEKVTNDEGMVHGACLGAVAAPGPKHIRVKATQGDQG